MISYSRFRCCTNFRSLQERRGPQANLSDAPQPPKGPRALRHQPSSTEESGGEEILYKPPPPRDRSLHRVSEAPSYAPSSAPSIESAVSQTDSNETISLPSQNVSTNFMNPPPTGQVLPPSAFQPYPTAKKRTSEEFERDQFGILVSKVTGMSLSSNQSDRGSDREDRGSRKHRSLGIGSPAFLKDRARDRRRTDSVGFGSGSGASKPRVNHSQQSSTSSQDAGRRIFSDFSRLAPSPSTTSHSHHLLQQIETYSVAATSAPDDMDGKDIRRPVVVTHHSSPNVAHSLLRGHQEGWSALDDSSAVEALRKLDGISGRTLRGRSSVGSTSRGPSSPGTPGAKGVPGEGKEAGMSLRDKERESKSHDSLAVFTNGVGITEALPQASSTSADGPDLIDFSVPVSEELPAALISSQPVGKQIAKEAHTPNSARSSYGLKRGSASSASASATTPTTTASSRDSASMSAATSATSASALSHRNSGGKLRRNSVGSDISSVHSSDFASQKDRVAHLVGGLDIANEVGMVHIPPVPPLPKVYQSPSAASFALPASSTNPPAVQSTPKTPAEDPDRTLVFPAPEIPPATPSKSPGRAPAKKWSFSALLPHSSSKDSSKSPVSPKASRGSRVNGHGPGHKGSIDNWSIIESPVTSQNRLHPSTSNASLLPNTANSNSPTPVSTNQSRTPERGVSSRAETSSSASTQTTSHAARTVTSPPSKSVPSTKRLTPSSIPFFRRSSSSSMHANIIGITSPSPPPAIPHHLSSVSISTLASKSTSNNSFDLDSSLTPVMPTPRKTSVLSLLKGTSSRRSVVVDKSGAKAKEKEDHRDKEKKDEKDRSESRISILMGRKRGKVRSSLSDISWR